MNELQIFNSNEFGDIRTVTIDSEPWFVGKDVATALGYSNSSKAVSVHVSEEDRFLKMLEADSQNGNVVKTQTALINESGLYALIFGSKLESAKRFKHWVTAEVLPTLRKSGSYSMSQPQGKELLALAVLEAQKTIEEKDAQIEEMKPHAILGQAITTANTYIGQYTDFESADSTDYKKYSWTKLKGDTGAQGPTGATGQAGKDALSMVVLSSAGTVFKNTHIATTLSAHVYKGGVEIIGSALNALGTIKWYKDGATVPTATGSELTINSGDVANSANYTAKLED